MIPPIMASTTYVDWRLCCFNAVVSVKEIQQNDRIAWGNPYLKNWPVFQSDAGSLKVSFDETKIINHNHYTFTIFTPISTIVFTTIIIIFLTIIIVYVQNWLPQMIRKASVNEEVELFTLCTLFVIIAIQQKVALTNNISPYTRKFYNKKIVLICEVIVPLFSSSSTSFVRISSSVKSLYPTMLNAATRTIYTVPLFKLSRVHVNEEEICSIREQFLSLSGSPFSFTCTR